MSAPTRTLALRVIELACCAPSVLNTQPWRWRVVDDATIDLYADRQRQLQVSDPSGRNLAISCGAALHHGFVAAQALSLTPTIELLPSPHDQDHLARLTLAPGIPTGEACESLQALQTRRTDRRRFTSWPIPDARLAQLAEAATPWGARAIPLTDVSTRHRAEQLVESAMSAQASDARYAEEQVTWIGRSRLDGIPMAHAAPHAPDLPSIRPNRFASDAEAASAAEAAARVVDSSDGLLAICSADDDQLAWLRAGETLSAVWLQATRDGLSIVPLSQVIEVDETREALHEDVFDGMARPQVLMRVGWLESTRTSLRRTPRRPVAEVLED